MCLARTIGNIAVRWMCLGGDILRGLQAFFFSSGSLKMGVVLAATNVLHQAWLDEKISVALVYPNPNQTHCHEQY